jgi:biotin-(acetyl-CoA carboxylase) ligase
MRPNLDFEEGEPMRIDIYHRFHLDEGSFGHLRKLVGILLGTINRKSETIMAKLEDVQTALTGIGTEVDKIGVETQALLDKVAQLETSNPDQQALIDAILEQANSIATRVKAVDDLVPDAAPPVEPPTDTPPTA